MEKKNLKVSFGTFVLTILLVIAIIVVIVMAMMMNKESTEKEIAETKVSELENNLSSMESTVNNLQGKLETISNTLNDNTETTEQKNVVNNNMVGTYSGSAYSGEDVTTGEKLYVNATLNLYSDGTATYVTTGGEEFLNENTKGTYKITDNAIEYTELGKEYSYSFTIINSSTLKAGYTDGINITLTKK